MRVLQYLAPHAFGGIETVVRSLVLGLHERNVEVRVAAMVPPGGEGLHWVGEMRSSGVTVDVLPPLGILNDREQLGRLLASWRPDVLHTHGYRADILTALTRPRPRTIATVHGFTPINWRLSLYCRTDQHALTRFDRVIAVSGPIRQVLLQRGVRADRVQVQHNGIDVRPAPEARAVLRRELGIPEDAFVIGTVGRLSPEKAQGDLLKAVARLDAPNAMVLLVGDGPCRTTLEDMVVDLGLGGRVRVLGPRRDVERLYPAMDVFGLSSHTEGSPAVLLEAFAYGIPVVATRVGAVPDMLIDGSEGMLVAPRDVEGLASALHQLLNDSQRRLDLGAAGLARYTREFRRERWLDRMEEAYRDLLSGPPLRGGSGH